MSSSTSYTGDHLRKIQTSLHSHQISALDSIMQTSLSLTPKTPNLESKLQTPFPVSLINPPALEKKESVQISGNIKTTLSVKILKTENDLENPSFDLL